MMKKYIFIIMLFCFAICSHRLFSQTDSVKYSKDFAFNEGFYLSYDEFKNNDPSIEKYFIEKNRKIFYYDKDGSRKKLRKHKFWGVCIHGRIYVYIEQALYELTNIAAISTISGASQSIKIDTVLDHPLSQPRKKNAKTYKVLFLMDFNSGNIYGYYPEDLQLLIKPDKELYSVYKSIKGYQKKKSLIFTYKTKFNERNPIYFPAKTVKIFDVEDASEVFIE